MLVPAEDDEVDEEEGLLVEEEEPTEAEESVVVAARRIKMQQEALLEVFWQGACVQHQYSASLRPADTDSRRLHHKYISLWNIFT